MIKTPLNNAILQSDLDVAGFELLNFPGTEAANGIPAGGTTGQSLTKTSDTDYDAEWSTITEDADTAPSSDHAHQPTATELLNSVAGTRTPIAALATGSGNFFDSQSMDPSIIVNPDDSTQLIMFFTGMGAPVSTGEMKIGRATASIYDPATWTVSNSGNAVMTAALAYETGGYGVRLDSVIYNSSDSKLYLFYTAAEGYGATCALASSTDLGMTWTKLGQILTPSGGEGTCSCCSVIMEGTTLHGIYGYRVGTDLYYYRYASASTSDWMTWTKGGVDIYNDVGRELEFHQLFKIGPTYLLVYESGDYTSADWDIRFATSTSPSGTWTRSTVNPFFVKSGMAGTFDRYHVATPQVVMINGYYYLFYCGAIDHSQPFHSNHWQMGVTPLLMSPQVAQLYIGTDLRLVPISGGGKLQARNISTGAWADVDQWTNP